MKKASVGSFFFIAFAKGVCYNKPVLTKICQSKVLLRKIE